MIEALSRFYTEENANIHRGVHELSQRATLAYERARANLQRFLNAADPHEIVFVRGATEAINLVAMTMARARFRPKPITKTFIFSPDIQLLLWLTESQSFRPLSGTTASLAVDNIHMCHRHSSKSSC